MRRAEGSRYHLVTQWQFDAPLEAVWEAIVRADGWPGWWSGVERVVTLEHGDARGLGARRHCTCKGVLPYRLTFVSRVTRIEALRLLEGRVEGELEGVGRCDFAGDSRFTVVRYDWQVRTTRPWMNLLAPLAKPLFRWNHDCIMRAGAAGLARHLGACCQREPAARADALSLPSPLGRAS